jgi:transposase-like protein
VVCDGLKGLPDAIGQTWPLAIVQTCVIHLLRNSFRYAGRQHYDALAKALRPVYTAPTEAAAKARFDEFVQTWGDKYPAIVRLWENAWAEFVPFLTFDVEIRKIVCSTNAIESVNARIRRAVRARGHFPTEQAALKCVYLAIMSLDPTGTGQRRWAIRWLSRHGARCRHCCRSVSPCRSPNPPCVSPRNGLSTVAAVRRG